MKLIGLTGGIATGKSTVTAMLRERGAQVLDADQIAREVVAPGTLGLAEIAARWPDVVGQGGALDRARLARRVFDHPEDRKALEAITHPRIQATVLERTRALADRGEKVAFYDAALLIESGLHQAMNGVILVVAPPEVQLQRLMTRNGLTREEAEQRVRAQLPLDEKKRHATWLIDNGGSLEATRAQVAQVWQEVTA